MSDGVVGALISGGIGLLISIATFVVGRHLGRRDATTNAARVICTKGSRLLDDTRNHLLAFSQAHLSSIDAVQKLMTSDDVGDLEKGLLSVDPLFDRAETLPNAYSSWASAHNKAERFLKTFETTRSACALQDANAPEAPPAFAKHHDAAQDLQDALTAALNATLRYADRRTKKDLTNNIKGVE